MTIFLFFFIVIIILAIIIVIAFTKKAKNLSLNQKKDIQKILIQIQKISSHKEQIVDLDKLYHKILKELGYTGTFGEILKKEPKEIKNIQKIWELHKLRNTLVHEFNSHNKNSLKIQAKQYIKEVKAFL